MLAPQRKALNAQSTTAVSVFQCIFCAETFTERSSLSNHMQVHIVNEQPSREQPLRCPACCFEAWNEFEFEKHVNTHVLGYTCVFCDFVTLKKSRLRSHLPEHAFERSFKCEICGLGFYKKDLLARHAKTHGPKSVSCTQCDYKTYSTRMLNEHVAAKHDNKHLYKCKDCPAEFRHSGDLSTHRRRVHRVQSNKFGRNNVKRCPDCPFETKRRPEFLLHRLEIHGKFPLSNDGSLLSCGVEGCSFVVNDDLKFITHVQSKHTPPGTCRLCLTENCEHRQSKVRGRPKKTAVENVEQEIITLDDDDDEVVE